IAHVDVYGGKRGAGLLRKRVVVKGHHAYVRRYVQPGGVYGFNAAEREIVVRADHGVRSGRLSQKPSGHALAVGQRGVAEPDEVLDYGYARVLQTLADAFKPVRGAEVVVPPAYEGYAPVAAL